MKQKIGDRMKVNYEIPSHQYLTRHVPVIIRVDGRAFHSLKFNKPFDNNFMNAMVSVTKSVLDNMQGGVLAYTQSDEISFLVWDWNRNSTSAWFDYRKSKLESITASLTTRFFAKHFDENDSVFDARAFSIPKEEVPNYFIWRYRDWTRNSLSMFARSFYSQKQLNNKNHNEIHEMLKNKNQNWAKLPDRVKNGTLVFSDLSTDTTTLDYDKLSQIIFPLLTTIRDNDAIKLANEKEIIKNIIKKVGKKNE